MHFIKFFFAFITYVFDGVVWWSDWRRRRWRRPWLGGCRKVCSHIIICCFLWRYRGVQFKHNIGSLLHGSSLCTLLYISFLLPNREYNSFKRIGRTHYKLSVLLHEWFSSWTLSSMSNTLAISTLVKSHHYHRTTIQWSTFFSPDRREELRRKLFIPIFGTRGRCFQCWRNVFLTEDLNQRTKSNWAEFMSVEISIEQQWPVMLY